MFNLKPGRGVQLNISHPQASGLIGLWLLNEYTGNKTFDYSKNNNLGIINEATWVPGGVNFDGGGTNFIDILNGKQFPQRGTLIIRVKFGSVWPGTLDNVFSNRRSSLSNIKAFRLEESSSGKAVFVTASDAGAGIDTLPLSNTTFLVNTEYDIILTWDAVLGFKRIYINKFLDTENISWGGSLPTTFDNFAIGGGVQGVRHFNGIVKNFIILNYPFNDNQVAKFDLFSMFEQRISPGVFFIPSSPSISPSVSPSLSPSISPSLSPSNSPSESPSVSPSFSVSPSLSPSASPSLPPTFIENLFRDKVKNLTDYAHVKNITDYAQAKNVTDYAQIKCIG